MKEKKLKQVNVKNTIRMLSYVKISLNGHWFVYVCK